MAVLTVLQETLVIHASGNWLGFEPGRVVMSPCHVTGPGTNVAKTRLATVAIAFSAT